MKRLRHRIALVWLALFALVGDMALIAPHHHDAPDLRARALTAGFNTTTPASPCVPGVPHGHDHDCTICWTAAIASSGVMPVAPAILAPPSWTSQRLALLQPAAAGLEIHHGFLARGPPVTDAA